METAACQHPVFLLARARNTWLPERTAFVTCTLATPPFPERVGPAAKTQPLCLRAVILALGGASNRVCALAVFAYQAEYDLV